MGRPLLPVAAHPPLEGGARQARSAGAATRSDAAAEGATRAEPGAQTHEAAMPAREFRAWAEWADRFFRSPRIRRLKAVLDKLDPPAPQPDPMPPPKAPREPSLALRRTRRRCPRGNSALGQNGPTASSGRRASAA